MAFTEPIHYDKPNVAYLLCSGYCLIVERHYSCMSLSKHDLSGLMIFQIYSFGENVIWF